MSTQQATRESLIAEFTAMVEGSPEVDRHDLFARLRRHMPIFHSSRLDAWVMTRYEDVKTVLSNDSLFQPLQQGAGASPSVAPSCR